MPHAHWAGQPALKLMVSSLLSCGRVSYPEQKEPWKVWGMDGGRGGVAWRERMVPASHSQLSKDPPPIPAPSWDQPEPLCSGLGAKGLNLSLSPTR